MVRLGVARNVRAMSQQDKGEEEEKGSYITDMLHLVLGHLVFL